MDTLLEVLFVGAWTSAVLLPVYIGYLICEHSDREAERNEDI